MAAIDAIRAHLERGDLHDGLVFDAVRVRLIEIGEAVKAGQTLPAELLADEPTLPWAQIAGMRDRLAHRYFDISHAILAATVSDDLPELEIAVRRLLQRLDDDTWAAGPSGSRTGHDRHKPEIAEHISPGQRPAFHRRQPQ